MPRSPTVSATCSARSPQHRRSHLPDRDRSIPAPHVFHHCVPRLRVCEDGSSFPSCLTANTQSARSQSSPSLSVCVWAHYSRANSPYQGMKAKKRPRKEKSSWEARPQTKQEADKTLGIEHEETQLLFLTQATYPILKDAFCTNRTCTRFSQGPEIKPHSAFPSAQTSMHLP